MLLARATAEIAEKCCIRHVPALSAARQALNFFTGLCPLVGMTEKHGRLPVSLLNLPAVECFLLWQAAQQAVCNNEKKCCDD